MNYLNIDVGLISTDQFLGATSAQIGVWAKLMRYCAIEENSGVIIECENWNDLLWFAKARVRKSEIKHDSPLWEWKYGNLCVWGYPLHQQEKAQANRKSASLGGASFSQRKKEAVRINGAKGGRPRKGQNNLSENLSENLT